jgi:thymidylate kinase
MSVSSQGEFLEQVQRSANSVGANLRIESDDKAALENCGAAEFSLLMAELHDAGYAIVSARPSGSDHVLGVMSTQTIIPQFFTFQLAHPSLRISPTEGLFLAFLGPDGVGKTTAVNHVMSTLKPVFDEQRLFHWRPQLIKPRIVGYEYDRDSGWLSINRHGDPPRTSLVSMLRLGGVYADYLLAQGKVIGPTLDRGGLVVFDRYFHDILVDCRRYRYGGPQWLLKVVRAILPQRNVCFVILDADDKVILSRKQEVSPDELRVQRRKYSQLARQLQCMHVRTDFGIDHTVAEILKGIGQHLTHAFDERLHKASHAVASVNPKTTQVIVSKTA